MTKVGDDTLTDMSPLALSDKTKVHLPSMDRQLGGTGLDRDMTAAALQEIMAITVVTYAAHGRTTGDIGKPLRFGAIWDDTSATTQWQHILHSIVDANTLRVVRHAEEITIPSALLTGGPGYSIASSGPFVYWDASAGVYTATRPVDSAGQAGAVLELITVSGANAFARVL